MNCYLCWPLRYRHLSPMNLPAFLLLVLILLTTVLGHVVGHGIRSWVDRNRRD
jgi:hypothetical protein